MLAGVPPQFEWFDFCNATKAASVLGIQQYNCNGNAAQLVPHPHVTPGLLLLINVANSDDGTTDKVAALYAAPALMQQVCPVLGEQLVPGWQPLPTGCRRCSGHDGACVKI